MNGKRTYYIIKDGIRVNASVEEAFPFLNWEKEKPIISVVGGGGKTTTMYALAEAFFTLGKKVLVTTTTHIYCPKVDCDNFSNDTVWPYLSVYASNLEDVKRIWENNRIPVIGEKEDGTKLCIPDSDYLKEAIALADAVVIEADGAKCLPCKVPIAKEPVILPESNIIVGVMGMDALGQPACEVCFRYETAKSWLHFTENHLISTDDMARILISEKGTRKSVGDRAYYIVLNKCDTEERLQKAEEIQIKIAELSEKINHVVFSKHKEHFR